VPARDETGSPAHVRAGSSFHTNQSHRPLAGPQNGSQRAGPARERPKNGNHRRASSAKERHVGSQDLEAVVGDEDVVLDPDAAEVEHPVDTVPVDCVHVLSAAFLVLQ
jgi:hypothetical protein